MAVHRIEQVGSHVTDFSVCESDEYSKQVYMKIDRHVVPENIRGTHEIFMSPDQLEKLGRFLLKQADEIRTAQSVRIA